MPAETQPYTFDRLVRTFMRLLVVVLLLWLVSATREVLVPLAVAFLLAYLLDPVVRFVERRIRNRTAAVLTTVIGSLVVLAGATALILPLIAGEVLRFGEMLRTAIQDDSPLRQWAADHLPANLAFEIESFRNSEEFRAFVSSPQFDTLVRGAQSMSGLLLVVLKWSISQVWGVVSGLMSLAAGLAGAFLIVLYLVFLLIDYRAVERSWKQYLPPAYRDEIVAFLSEFNAAMARYFRGQFLIASIVGVLFAVGFKIIGLKMGIMLGLFIGALNMVPYLQTIGLIPAIVLALFTAFEKQGNVWGYVISVALVFVAVQALQDAVLTPRIMGKVTGLRPAMLLFSVLFWGKLLGFLGLVLAIPLTCLGLAYYRRLLARSDQPSTGPPTSTP